MIFEAARHSVSFWNGSAMLVGDLVIPAGPGPHPVVILVPGVSGPRERGRWSEDLAQGGLATLTWDSPGWGESFGLGTWQPPNQRAMEILAGVDFLHTMCSISTQGIAVIGADLGGWAAVLAAALSSRIEALVLLTPPIVSTAHQIVDRLARRLRVAGFISAEIDLAQAVLCERVRRLGAGHSPDSIYASEAACRPAPWYPWLPGTTPSDIEAFATVLAYDPWTLIRPLQCPILAVLGEDDPATPAYQGAELLRRVFTTPEQHDRHIAVLPRTDNGLRPVWAADGDGPQLPGDWNPETVSTITSWVTPRIGHRRSQYTTPY